MNNKLNLQAVVILAISILLVTLAHISRSYLTTDNSLLILIIASLPSFAAALGGSMLPIIFNSKKPKNAIIAIATGLIIYEFEQYFSSKTFDINDIIAILLGAIIGYFIYTKTPKVSEGTIND